MPKNASHIEMLLQRFSNQQASEEEVRELFLLVSQEGNDQEFIRLLEEEMESYILIEPENQERRDQVLLKIKNVIGIMASEPSVSVIKRNYKWLAIASVVATIVFGAGMFYYTQKSKIDPANQVAVTNDAPPGKMTATLTLANGKKIRLSDAVNGTIANESGVSVTKSANGQLEYKINGSETDPNKMNTLSTAKGETYRVRLQDGSSVYLNAASSLTYPASLNRNGKRVVSLTGEGYFEIAKDKVHPFVVKTGNQEVEVLGTHFNVNAYGDERAITTTLLEGSVKVSAGKKQKVIKPGEQAQNDGSNIHVAEVNVDNIVDWKDGDFFLNRVNFKIAMRKIARWYDVEFVYDASVPDELESGGWISRKNNLSAVLKSIESSGQVHFKVAGNKVYVSK